MNRWLARVALLALAVLVTWALSVVKVTPRVNLALLRAGHPASLMVWIADLALCAGIAFVVVGAFIHFVRAVMWLWGEATS